ncbi:MAG: hypothetical protein KF833_14285 [Verrucomicrobiae bacterium]|nr:hypothetical protein [Verrucomicrobiae bacterium]
MSRRTVSPAELDGARHRAVLRGLDYLGRIACHPRRLPTFGSGLLYCCAFMASTAAHPEVRRRARTLARRGWLAWRHLWTPFAPPDSADEVAELVHGHCAAQRLGLRFPRRRAWLREHATRFQPADFLGWDPLEGPPPRTLRLPCDCGWIDPGSSSRCRNPSCLQPRARQGPHRTWCLALTATYCGERLDVPLGRRYADVLAWLPHLPDYPSPSRGVVPFYEAAYTVTHIVYTLNDYGRYQLDPRWLPREYRFLADHLEDAIALEDDDLLGEFLDTLRAFGIPNEHPAIHFAMRHLLDRQNSDGSWGPTENGHDYHRFHTTWAVLDGLRDFAWQGSGIAFPRLLPRLRQWARAA